MDHTHILLVVLLRYDLVVLLTGVGVLEASCLLASAPTAYSTSLQLLLRTCNAE